MKQIFSTALLSFLFVINLESQTLSSLSAVQFVDANSVVACGASGTIVRSNDGANSWFFQASGTTRNLLGVSFSGASIGIVVGGDAGARVQTILTTNDGGNSWISRLPVNNKVLKGVSFVDMNLGFAVGDSGTIIRTTNGGSSFEIQSSGTTQTLDEVDFIDANNGIAVGTWGTILRTTNGGTSWVSSTSGTTAFLFGVSYVNSNIAYVAGNGGVILKTTNGGTSWSALSSGTTTNLRGVHFIDANTGWAVGWYGIILRTTNGGASWSVLTSGISNDLSAVSFINANNGVVVGTNGSILCTSNGGITWTLQSIGGGGSAPSAPTLSSPTNSAVDQATSLTLSWNTSSGATSYRVQLSTSSSFTSTIVDDSTLTSTSKSVSGLSNSTVYYWRVNAKNSYGTSAWSSTWSFTTASGAISPPSTPVLLSPANGAIDQSLTPTLSWDASSGATSYRLQVSTSSTFSTLIVDDGTLTGTSKQIGPLSNATTYYWRVSASNTGGTSAYSTVWSFTTVPVPPSAPTLLSPANGAIDQPTTLTLSWNASSDATSYRLQVSTSSTFSSTVVDVSQSGTSRQVGPLSNSTVYYWRVSASNTGGTSAYSSVWNFTVLAAQVTSPVFSVDKKSIDFGNVTVSTKKTDSVTVTNTGNADLTISSVVSTNSKFTITPTAATIAPGASRKVYITFAPNRKIVYTGKIVFTHNAANAKDTVTVSGTGIGAVKTTSKVISFGSIPHGTTQTQSFTVYNEGDIPLEILKIESTNDVFSVNPKTAIVDVADSVTVSVTAKPKSVKKESGFIILKYKDYEDFDSVAVDFDVVLFAEQNNTNLPTAFTLHQNYPNPFNPATKISVDLPNGGQARLVIYNILGEQVAILMEGIYAPGSYDVTWLGQDGLGSQAPSGIYLYKLDAGSFSQTKRMQLMK